MPAPFLTKGDNMKIENVPVALLAYFELNMMPQIPTSFGKAMTYGGLLLKMPQLEQALKENASMFTDGNGDVDLQKIKNIGVTVFDKVPQIEIGGFTFEKNDFEALITFLSTQA